MRFACMVFFATLSAGSSRAAAFFIAALPRRSNIYAVFFLYAMQFSIAVVFPSSQQSSPDVHQQTFWNAISI